MPRFNVSCGLSPHLPWALKISNINGTDVTEAIRDLDAEETLFIVSSKTFPALETITNAYTARDC